ncbi:MAG: cystathionine gamma-synthase [Candidatus Riflebacteria bacterium]|nr:cystathionine gamma-synthase [Candidatus Riflebacteria bacterium]
MKFSTKAIHAGQKPDPATGATVVPIYQTATYTQEEVGRHKGYEYSRTGNPTRTALEECLASLEDGRYACAFSSGLAAADAALSWLRPYDHVVANADLYGGTYRLFETVYKTRQVDFCTVDGVDPSDFQKAIRPTTKLIWVESPTNPLLQVIDLASVAEICAKNEIAFAVDNTFATPYFQNPLNLGADLVIHSTTKYIGGHSDVVGGAVVTRRDDLADAIKFHQNAVGAIPGPFDAWLILRGVKTLAVRMVQHEENARRVALFLSGHPRVKSVAYPGLGSHPQHKLAAAQMTGFGGMVTFRIDGGPSEANDFLKRLKIFSLAESLGGVESLARYPPLMTHGSIPKAEREHRGICEGTIRLSVGIEDAEDLIEDLAQAFDPDR